MNKQKLYTMLIALLCAMATWAQEPTSVSTENELRAAVQINNGPHPYPLSKGRGELVRPEWSQAPG